VGSKLAVWAIFGAFLLPRLLREGLAWRPLLYAVLSLTVVRMLPVAVAYVGSGRRWETRLFVGWFGPRGLASVVFLLLSYDALRAEGVPTATLVTAASWTIVLSVLAHGISAGPAARWYATRARRFAPESPELRPAPAAPAPQRALGAPRARR